MGFLMLLPAAVAGFVCGMLYMRGCYLAILRKERIEHARQQRYARQDAEKQRHVGFAVGYRMGSQK
jgi:hypothetical protein